MPQRKDGAFIKLERLKQIQKQIASGFPNPVDYDRTVIWTELNIGLTKEKSQDYINKLIEGNGWVLVDGKIRAEV